MTTIIFNQLHHFLVFNDFKLYQFCTIIGCRLI